MVAALQVYTLPQNRIPAPPPKEQTGHIYLAGFAAFAVSFWGGVRAGEGFLNDCAKFKLPQTYM
eukprot:1101781-Amphidinium_carterae.1